jgi:alginate O-acetyltransferase complex protein AlgI
MLISGLWHASWLHKTALLWGALHGLYLVGERLVWMNRPVVPPKQWSQPAKLLGILVVFLLTTLAWVPFREGSGVGQTLTYWQGLANWSAVLMPDWRILIFILPSLLLDWSQSQRQGEAVFLRWPLLARSALLALAVLAIVLIQAPSGGATFIYQGF